MTMAAMDECTRPNNNSVNKLLSTHISWPVYPIAPAQRRDGRSGEDGGPDSCPTHWSHSACNRGLGSNHLLKTLITQIYGNISVTSVHFKVSDLFKRWWASPIVTTIPPSPARTSVSTHRMLETTWGSLSFSNWYRTLTKLFSESKRQQFVTMFMICT